MSKLTDYLEIALAVHAAASIICALTPTRKDDDILGRIYKVLEFLALNIGRAKDRWLIIVSFQPEISIAQPVLPPSTSQRGSQFFLL